MSDTGVNVLQVSPTDGTRNADRVALRLLDAFAARGLGSWLAVGHKTSAHPHVVVIPNDRRRGRWFRAWNRAARQAERMEGVLPGAGAARRALAQAARPRRWLDTRRGVDHLDYPGTWELPDV